jgi:queuine tRNA-ribosyltransferase
MSSDKPAVRYESIATDGAARLGRVHTPHGYFDTPAFMPVGTNGTLKGLVPQLVKQTGAQCILGNTYHLMLRPGEKVVKSLGDLHQFMSWDGPILTDSGGFQVFSLADLNHIDEKGVTFKSHIDGKTIHLTPQKSIQVQNDLGADIMMCFDQCPPSTASRDVQELAVERSLRWAKQCIEAHERPDAQGLFGIVQGGTLDDLRRYCARELVAMNFPGYAVGGLAVGEGFEQMMGVLDVTLPELPTTKPRYMMGVGYPKDIVHAVARGIDMFDCVLPTRNGRTGNAFTQSGQIRLKNAKFIEDKRPIEEGCDCHACQHFSRGAIRHFVLANEMLGPILISLHNVRFYQRLMADIRQSIREGRFGQFVQSDPRAHLGAPASDAAAQEGPQESPQES